MPAQPELPLRPMTLGELLDAAIVLLRRRALPLFCAAAVLAGARAGSCWLRCAPPRLSPPYYGPADGPFRPGGA